MPLIAVDAMGGDNAPDEIVRGAILAAEDGARVVLVGDEEQVVPLLDGSNVDIDVVHASEVIEMGDVPARAIREKKDASIVIAARMVASGDADALVSAGSTGAVLASAALLIGRLQGVSRPGIASVFPLGHVIMDVGANIECSPEHLLQFAVMGSAVSTVYVGVENPRVGLLNNGEESSKGRSLERVAFDLLSSSAAVNFVGNVEGRDIATEDADVIVTDGFTGNVLLKTAEGTGKIIQQIILEILSRPERADSLKDLMPALMDVREKMSADAAGGAHLVGTEGVVVVSHGSASSAAVINAIRLADEGATNGLVEKVRTGLEAAVH